MFDSEHQLCAIEGREAELMALIASLVPEVEATQQSAAEQLRDFVESLSNSPAMSEPDEDAEWIAQRSGDHFSLFGPDLLITASFVSGEVGGIHISNDDGTDWQFDFPAVMQDTSGTSEMATPELRVRAYRDFQCVSDACFEADGSVTNPRDWEQSIQEGQQQLDETLEQMPTVEELEDGSLPDRPRPEFASMPGAGIGGGVPGLGASPGLGNAMAGVGRIAAGAAIGAAVGLAGAALRGRGKSKESPQEAPSTEPVGKPADASKSPPAESEKLLDDPPTTIRGPKGRVPAEAPYPGSTAEGSLRPPWKIRVLAGPEAGSIYPLKLQSSLGRGNDNEIQVLDPEISRNHLRFDVRDDAVVVTDLGSSRGTLVDGQKIERPTPLRIGQIVEAGRSRFVLEGVTAAGLPAIERPPEVAKTMVGPTPAQGAAAPPKTGEAIWHYAEKGKQHGPVTEAALRDRLAKDLPRETLVWHAKLDGWKPAHTLGLCPAPAPKTTDSSPSGPDKPSWYYMEKGARKGPLTEADLRKQLASGLSPDTMVWRHTFDTWKSAAAAGLSSPAEPPAAAPERPSSQEAPIWYYMDKDVRQGPVAESVLRLRLRKDLSPETPVWTPELDGWEPAHSLGLCSAPAPVSAPPTAPAPAPQAAATEWYFMEQGARQGPVAESVLRQRLASGLPPDTPVWHAGLDGWKPAHAQGLCTSGAVPAAAPPAPAAAGRKCAKCGRDLSPQHKFCAGCGSPVG